MSKTKIVSFNGPPAGYIVSGLSALVDPSSFEVVAFQGKPSDREIIDAVKDADMLFMVPGGVFLNQEILEAARNVKFIKFMSVGYDNIDLDAATELRIPVANNAGWAAPAVAEHSIMLILMTLKQAIYMYTKAIQQGWAVGEEYPERREFKGKTLGILGLGSIGREVARLAQPFGVKVLYNKRRRLTEVEEVNLGVMYRTFDDLLTESDILSIHVPLTQETQGIIDGDALSKMKDGVIIINTSRKEVVDEKAIFDALESGKLFGFGTDFQPDHPLTGQENVVMTPHSSITPAARNRAGRLAFENIHRFLRGEKPLYLVNDVWPS
jgi:phosphoglycerate dehydrogenase-like enzyme